MRRSFYHLALVFTGLLFANFSCQDHVVPQKEAQIKTESRADLGTGVWNYRLSITDLGNVPITEYGIVYVTSALPAPLTPTVSDTKIIFPLITTLGLKTRPGLKPVGANIFYRAYAILENGSVVYGETNLED
ncbi:MAG: hypothetical protein ABIN80_11625 [Dyadobacter sp.]|uniref:hypothetical protein n=1 Tax=Dyadobacter sp. TaxID=1914288 RepID=UPI003263A0B7